MGQNNRQRQIQMQPAAESTFKIELGAPLLQRVTLPRRRKEQEQVINQGQRRR